jgi:hypothetical protein
VVINLTRKNGAGSLATRFGARGHGGKNPAAAHYERDATGAVTPNRVVINLTRKNGAGSLAHEWFHAVDNYFARMRGEKGGFLTEKPFERGPGVRPEMAAAFKELMKTINQTGLKERSKELDKKRVKDYWSIGLEMAARSFESYVIAKLQDQGASNDYLANVVDQGLYQIQAAYPYPSMGEMPQIRAAFDNFFATVQTRYSIRVTWAKARLRNRTAFCHHYTSCPLACYLIRNTVCQTAGHHCNTGKPIPKAWYKWSSWESNPSLTAQPVANRKIAIRVSTIALRKAWAPTPLDQIDRVRFELTCPQPS